MNNAFFVGSLCAVMSLSLLACDNKPTQGKPEAKVGAAVETPKPAADAKPADGAKPAEGDKPAEGAAAAKTESLEVTPENSKLGFVGAKVTGKHEGKFEKFSGKVELDPAAIDKSSVKLEIEMASVKTDDAKLDGHLKNADFFDVEKFPKATFESTSIKAGGEGGATHTLTGNLDFHGVKKSIEFPATIKVSDDKLEAKAEFGINRKDFGVEYAGKTNDLIKDEVLIKWELELPRKK